MAVEDEHLDVLQNLEFAIHAYRKDQPALLDLDVIEAFEFLIRGYGLEEQGRPWPRTSTGDRTAALVEKCRDVCDWRLGRRTLASARTTPDDPAAVTAAIVIQCLKRLRKSAKLWNEQGGRQGYLDYISQFLS
jgi:hypothetical protein